jgi:site-specific DNA-cytosine methylase
MRLQVPKNSVFVDLNFQRGRTYPNSGIYCPCLNTNSGLWNVKMGRYANCNEYLMLQGFPKDFKKVVSISQFKKQIGNSMSVNILKKIINNLIF